MFRITIEFRNGQVQVSEVRRPTAAEWSRLENMPAVVLIMCEEI